MRYDFACDTCEHVFEHICTISEYKDVLACPKCGSDATRRYFTIYQSNAIMGAPTVVFKDQDGKIHFPGSASEPTPAGFQRIELCTMKERRAFAAQQDSVAKEQWERRMSGEKEHYDRVLHENRAELSSTLKTNYGRDFFRVAVEQNNERLRKRYSGYTPGCRFDITE